MRTALLAGSLVAALAATAARAETQVDPDCRWSKTLRSNPNVICPGDKLDLSFPTYDVEAACRKSGLDQSSCVEYVQPYYDRLLDTWTTVDDRTKLRCLSQHREVVYARYVQIASCIEAELARAEMDRRKSNPTRFRY